MIKTVTIAAIVAMTASASVAGSLNTQYEAEPQQEEIAVVPAGSSGIGVPVVIGGLLAAAAIAAIVSNDSDSDTDTPED
ncbi:MAG: hypothetical protein V7661_09800 [Sulfitobacter sp.]